MKTTISEQKNSSKLMLICKHFTKATDYLLMVFPPLNPSDSGIMLSCHGCAQHIGKPDVASIKKFQSIHAIHLVDLIK